MNLQLLSFRSINNYDTCTDVKSNAKTVYIQNTPRPKRECIKNFTDEICSYDCKKVHTNAGCANTPYGNCVTTPWHVTCGINCTKDKWDKITCDRVTYTSDK